MEISKEFLSYLEKIAKRIDIFKLAHPGQSVSDAFPKLIEMGERGEIAYVEWSGKKYYTFMSEDEMYMTMCGKTKEEFLKEEQAKAESYKQEREQKKRDCEKIKEEKFPGITKSISEFFPSKTADSIISDMLKDLDKYYDFDLERAETLISLLETAKTKPASEAVKAYMESAHSPESRLFNYALLKKSYFGDVFMFYFFIHSLNSKSQLRHSGAIYMYVSDIFFFSHSLIVFSRIWFSHIVFNV